MALKLFSCLERVDGSVVLPVSSLSSLFEHLDTMTLTLRPGAPPTRLSSHDRSARTQPSPHSSHRAHSTEGEGGRDT